MSLRPFGTLLQISIGWDCEDWCANQIKNRRFWPSSRGFESRLPTVEFVIEESAVEEHQSNGTIEVTVREIQKQVQVMKNALEERMKYEVPSRHPILAFFVEHAGKLMSRYQVCRDGRTAFELHACKPNHRQLVEFGERVYFMPNRPEGARQAKLDPKWQDEAFIDIRDRCDEMLIMTTSGVQDEGCSETPRFGALGFRNPHDVEGYARGIRIRRRER